MRTLTLHLESATQYERVETVVSFVGEDESGSFGILPGHARMMTVLTFGLARFRVVDEGWQFLAAPGAVVYHIDDQLHLSTRRYLRGADYESISAALQAQLLAEEQALHAVKQSIRRLEEEMLKRLSKIRRSREMPI